MTDPTSTKPEGRRPRRVLIAGAGVAGLEAAFALRDLAGDRVTLTLLADTDRYVERPMAVAEPFTTGHARHYALADLAGAAHAELVTGALRAVDPEGHQVMTEDGSRLTYDELILCLGARLEHPYAHTSRFDDSHLDDLLHGLVQDVEGGYVRRLAIVVPAPMPWPLPPYELALMAAERAWEMRAEMQVTVLTPETAPLAVFGAAASHEVSRLLADRGIDVVTSAHCEIPEAQRIVVHPGGRVIAADRIVSLPTLIGPSIEGLPADGNGFIPIDEYGRVPGVTGVWAAGDATDYPLKHGSVAAQLADTVAAGVAAAAGADVRSDPFSPTLEGVLLTGGRPRAIHGRPATLAPDTSAMAELDRRQASPKIAARHLTPRLREAAPMPGLTAATRGRSARPPAG